MGSLGELRQDLTSRLARELAVEQYTLPEVLEKLGLSEEFYEELARDPAFCAQLLRERDAWNAPENLSDRVKFKAGTIVERWLVEAYGRMHDQRENLTAKTELAKLMAKLGGMDARAGDISPTDKFVVNINLGSSKLHYEKVVEASLMKENSIGALPLDP